jgi:5-deoxy-glucuronate isomerase
MNIIVKAARAEREIVHVTPQSAGWRYVGFSAYRLRANEALDVSLPGREVCIVVLAGHADVSVAGASWPNLGNRNSVFDDKPPVAVYAPDGRDVRLGARSECEIGIAHAPGGGSLPPRLIEPHTMKRSVRGIGANTRYVTDILPQTEPAEHLLVVEVRTPSGHSSSYPPHKHDRDALPHESALEETYYHRLNPAQGFAFQRVYTDDRSLDESVAVEDHDVVMVPRGYHPVVVPYGYESYYLNVMAGPTREWHFANDPVHEWMLRDR